MATKKEEDVALFLNDEASRYYTASIEMRYLAADLKPGLVRTTMEANADGFEAHSVRCMDEAARLLATLPEERIAALRDRIVAEAREATPPRSSVMATVDAWNEATRELHAAGAAASKARLDGHPDAAALTARVEELARKVDELARQLDAEVRS